MKDLLLSRQNTKIYSLFLTYNVQLLLSSKHYQSYTKAVIDLPKPKVDGYNLSYSGIKSCLARMISKLKEEGKLDSEKVEEIACSAEHAFVDQLLSKIKKAAKDYAVKQIIVGGGVSANSYLRSKIQEEFNDKYDIVLPITAFVWSLHNLSIETPPGYGKSNILATLSKLSPIASSCVSPIILKSK